MCKYTSTVIHISFELLNFFLSSSVSYSYYNFISTRQNQTIDFHIFMILSKNEKVLLLTWNTRLTIADQRNYNDKASKRVKIITMKLHILSLYFRHFYLFIFIEFSFSVCCQQFSISK